MNRSNSTLRLHVVLDALRELYAPCAPGGFQRQLLEVVQRLIPGLHYNWDELRRLGEQPEMHNLHDLSGVMPMSEFFEIYTRYVDQHPVVRHADKTIRSAVHQPTDFATKQEWERTDFYQLLLRPYGIRYQIAAQVRTEFLYGGLLVNSDRPFTEEQRALLTMLLPHIRQAHNQAERLAAGELERAYGGRLMERGAITCDTAGRFAAIGAGTLAVLREFFPENRIGQASAVPETVVGWARDGLTRFLRSPDLPEPPADLVVQGGGGVLRLTLHPDFRKRWQMVSLHVLRPVAAPAPALVGRQLGLTVREAEVLHWLAEGKRNAEIAIILASSTGTVRKQVESVFEKLRVETRSAAAAAYFRAMRGLG